MEPRKSRASKWTELPKDYIKQVGNALRESFADEIKTGRFIVEGRIYSDELLIRMGFLEKGRLRQRNFEMSMDYRPGKDDTLKLLNLAVDVGATMLEELFSSASDLDFPRTWQPFEVEGRTVYVQFSADNSELEQAADELLGRADPSLVKDAPPVDEDEEILKELQKKMGLDDVENDYPDDEDSSNDDDDGAPPIKH